MSSSVGIFFPIYGKHVPNHQPDQLYLIYIIVIYEAWRACHFPRCICLRIRTPEFVGIIMFPRNTWLNFNEIIRIIAETMDFGDDFPAEPSSTSDITTRWFVDPLQQYSYIDHIATLKRQTSKNPTRTQENRTVSIFF